MTGTGGATQTGGQTGLATGGGTGYTEPTAGTGGTDGTPPPPVCGNNIKEEGEICDGSDLAGATCGSLAAGQEGTLSCADDCLNYNVDLCYTPTPPTADASVQSDGGYGT